MKRYDQSVQGATLLEIMLVLAIAAMIIVMSIRFYQSASNAQSANSILQQFQAITAAADNLGQASGGYLAAGVDAASIKALIGSKNLNSPFGAVTIGTATATTFPITFPSVPVAVCTIVTKQIQNNPKAVSANTCSGVANLIITYDSTK